MQTFTGTYTAGLVLSDSTTQNPATVTSAGLVDVNSTSANASGILGNAGFPWTVANQGTVESIGSLGVGIDLQSGGVVTNGTGGATNALISGSYRGLVINSDPGTVSNYGTIQGTGVVTADGIILGAGGEVTNGAGGSIQGVKNGVYINPSPGGAAGTLINQGTITSLGALEVNGKVTTGIAAYVPGNSFVQNGQSGSSGGLIEGYYIGVRTGLAGVSGIVGSITNFGTIDVVSQSGTLPFDIGVQGLAPSNVANYGTITALGQGGGVGIQLPEGGGVQNGSRDDTTALIAGYIHAIGSGYNATTTVVNFGTLESTMLGLAVRQDTGATVLFHYGGNLINYGLIQGQLNGVWTGMNGTKSSFAGAGTVTNLGTILQLSGLQQNIYPRAVYLHGGGVVTNGESGSSAGLISAEGNAIVVNEPGTVRNFGTIQSLETTFGAPGTLRAAGVVLTNGGVIYNGAPGATGAQIQAYEMPVYVGAYRSVVHPGAVGTVINFGTITQVGSGTVAASSIAFLTDGAVVNYGLIGSTGSTGVSFLLTPGLIANFGTINSTASAAAGIDLHSGGLITNGTGGVISGLHDGVRVGGALSPVTTIGNYGTIAGSTGICINPEDNGSNTVVNFGTIIGTGGTAINLGSVSDDQVVIEAGSSLQGVIANLQPGDSIDLPSMAFNSHGSANLSSSNVLQITENSATFAIDLDPAQNFGDDFFSLASDGGGGTVVTEETTTPSVALASTLSDFSWAQGWGSADDPRIVTDVNGDGISDYVGFGYSATFIAYGGTFSNGQGSDGPGFSGVTEAVQDFGTSEGYTADDQRGAAAAGVGDGDILYGQGDAGIYWYEATGETAQTDAAGNTYDVLQYQTSPNFYGNFGSNEGWTPDNGFQILKTDSTDASASILGFGDDGIVVGPDAFASGATAADSYVIPLAVGNNSGWNQSVDIRTFTDQNGKPIDLNGDGIADFVGMGPNGLVYAYGSDSGPGGAYELGPLQTADIDGGNADLGDAQGWTDATTVRDIVYDANTGYDDIIAFGAAGVYVSMGQDPATHNGQPFGQLYLALADFGSDQGWSVSQTPRLVGDVTGNGIPDIVGFGTSDTYVAVGSYDSSGNLQFTIDPAKTIADFGSAEGWSGSAEQTLRALGTFPGTGSTSAHSDLILSGASNTQVWYYS